MRDANGNNWAYPLNSGIEKTLTNLRNPRLLQSDGRIVSYGTRFG
jgi:hypothetical protein